MSVLVLTPCVEPSKRSRRPGRHAEVHGLAVEIAFIVHEVCLVIDDGCLAAQFGTDVVDRTFFAGIAVAVFDVADVFAVELDLADFDVSPFAGLDVSEEVD